MVILFFYFIIFVLVDWTLFKRFLPEKLHPFLILSSSITILILEFL